MLFQPRGRFLIALILCSIFVLAVPAEIVIPSAPEDWATDTAGFLSPDVLRSLNIRLGTYARQTGQQILIYIGKTTGGYPIEEFAVKAFEAWKAGRAGIDNGLIVFVMSEDRKIRIEVGYGLESVVTDAKASRIINEIMAPRIRAGDNDGALGGAVDALLSVLTGKTLDQTSRDQGGPSPQAGSRGRSAANTILIIIGVIVFLVLFITNPSFALWLLFNILTGGRGGGGFGGGGKFRGGGGRSGGGGASGGW